MCDLERDLESLKAQEHGLPQREPPHCDKGLQVVGSKEREKDGNTLVGHKVRVNESMHSSMTDTTV